MPRAAAADRPHDGLAAPDVRRLRRVRRLVHLSDGRRPRHGRLRRGARGDGRRVLRPRRPAGVQDAPARLEDPRAAASASPGARRRSPRAATTRSRRRFNAPGLLLVGEGAGLVNVPRLKGVHYAIESGRLAAEAAFRALQRGEVPSRVGALDSYDEALRDEPDVEGAARGAQHAPGLRQGLLRRRRAREHDDRHEGPRARTAASRRIRTRRRR